MDFGFLDSESDGTALSAHRGPSAALTRQLVMKSERVRTCRTDLAAAKAINSTQFHTNQHFSRIVSSQNSDRTVKVKVYRTTELKTETETEPETETETRNRTVCVK